MSENSSVRHGLTSAQHEVWLAQQLDPRGAHYRTGSCLEIDGPLDHAVLSRALRLTVAGTETLCSRFLTDEEGRPYRAYCPPAPEGSAAVEDPDGVPYTPCCCATSTSPVTRTPRARPSGGWTGTARRRCRWTGPA